MKYSFKEKNNNNKNKTNKYYDSDEEVKYIDPDDYGGMFNPYGLPDKEELDTYLSKKNKLIIHNNF